MRIGDGSIDTAITVLGAFKCAINKTGQINVREENEKEINGYIDMAIDALKKQPKIGGWIPCSERLPEEKINPVTKDFYEYQVTFQSEDVTDVRHYKFGNGHWWNGPGIMDEYVTAWREPLEMYHG